MRVHPNGVVSWILLQMVMRVESEDIVPQLQDIVVKFASLCDETRERSQALDSLLTDIEPILADAKTLQADTTPLWDDTYTLCGNPQCEGDCRVCQEGEEDYEDITEEKYCRRRR